jgi:hypothetical protein
VKGSGHRKAAIPESEPNFYRQFPLYEKENAAPVLSAASLMVPVLSVVDVGPFEPTPPLYLHDSKPPSHLQESMHPPQLQEATHLFHMQKSPPNPQLPNVPQVGLQHHDQWAVPFVQSAPMPTMTATSSTLGVQVGPITIDPGDGEQSTDPHSQDFSSSDSSSSSSISQSSRDYAALPQYPKRQEFVPSNAKQRDLDPSLMFMGEQQGLFSAFLDRAPSSPCSLSSAMCYQSYQNHDIIADALRAVAPFYPDIK